MRLCQGLKGLVRMMWVYIGIIVRNDRALRAVKMLYMLVCDLCVARDSLSNILS